MLKQPLEALTPARQPGQASTSGRSPTPDAGQAVATMALADAPAAATTTPGSPTSTAATEVSFVHDPIQVLPRNKITTPSSTQTPSSPTPSGKLDAALCGLTGTSAYLCRRQLPRGPQAGAHRQRGRGATPIGRCQGNGEPTASLAWVPPIPQTPPGEIPSGARTTNAQCPTAGAAPRRSRSARRDDKAADEWLANAAYRHWSQTPSRHSSSPSAEFARRAERRSTAPCELLVHQVNASL